MRVDSVVRDIRHTIEQIIRALNGNLTASDNMAGEGTAGQVLTSNGTNSPPTYQDAPGSSGSSSGSGDSVEASSLVGNIPDNVVLESNVTQHEGALSIQESQIVDGAILARETDDINLASGKVYKINDTPVVPVISAYGESLTPWGTASGTLVDVPNAYCDIVLTQQAYIVVIASFEIETYSGAAASVIAVAVNVDDEDHDEEQRYLSGLNDKGIGSIVHRAGPFDPGSHRVKLRYRKVSGTATPGINNAHVLALATG